ncbi:hypothetical protein HII36_34940 [Nonomuraea sp. NN258]|uniref:hypothetical protein n=1 Tax=Nonomuraea antri TaxID=2730852 RepID=UPI0015693B4A|nr:hypothetical protein [Nonomuraea antri]NRQ36998.1 hypothetical protein [Nonomuraea antri]
MSGFLAQLAQKAAERWLTQLLLPGVVFAAVSTVTWLMDDPFDPRPAVSRIETWLGGGPSGGMQALASAAFLAGAVMSGFAARGLAHGVESLWFAARLGLPGRVLTAWRAARWNRRHRKLDRAVIARYREGPGSPADPEAALAARNRICLIPPERPTWMGDRMRAAGERVYLAYSLDLASLWPRLWLTVPDSVRVELATARSAVTGDARLFAWGLLYLVPGTWWWPALLIPVPVCVIAVRRARGSADVLGDLVESAVDLHGREVAERLGFTTDGTLAPDVGDEVRALLRKEY